MLLSLAFLALLALPLVLLAADLARGRRGGTAPPAPSHGDRLRRRA